MKMNEVPQSAESLEFRFDLDDQGRVRHIDSEGFALLGYGAADLDVPLGVLKLVADSHRDRVAENLARALRGERLGLNLYTLKSRSGRTFPVLVSSELAARGGPLRCKAFVLPTGSHLAGLLWEHQQMFRTVIEAIPSGLALVNAQGRISHWNPSAAALTGLELSRVIGQKCHEVFQCPHHDQLCPLARGDKGKCPSLSTTVMLAAPDRTIHLQKTSNYIHDSEGRVIGAIESFVDVTQAHETGAALHEARELLESARNAKRRFMANMSHEIRTPLNAIWGLLDLMLADETTPPAHCELLASARRSAQLLVDLIDDILDFTVIDKGIVKLESTGFSLRSVLSSVIARQHDLTRNKAVSIHSQVADDVPDNLLGDSGRLYQILKHLVGNGIKFTPAGEVAVEVQRWPSTNPTGDRGVELHFSIRDTGIGIAREKLSQIFESLSQGDDSSTRSFGGLGIGLNIVKRLVELLEGRIWIQSAPGEGTTVHFLLPFRNTANADEPGAAPPQPAAADLDDVQTKAGWVLNPRPPAGQDRPHPNPHPASACTAPLSAQWWQLYQRCQGALGTDPAEAEELLKALRIEAGAAGYSDLSTVLFRLLLAVRRNDPSEIEQYHALLQRTVPQGHAGAEGGIS